MTKPGLPVSLIGASGVPTRLAEARATIDNIDARARAYSRRAFPAARGVGHIKARGSLRHGYQRYQVERLRTLAASSGLDPTLRSSQASWCVRSSVTTRTSSR